MTNLSIRSDGRPRPWATRTCPAMVALAPRRVAVREVGEWVKQTPANPPKGFGPARIVQLAPNSGAGMLVTAVVDGRRRRVLRANPADVKSSTRKRPDHKGLSVNSKRVDAENVGWGPIGTCQTAKHPWSMGNGGLLHSPPRKTWQRCRGELRRLDRRTYDHGPGESHLLSHETFAVTRTDNLASFQGSRSDSRCAGCRLRDSNA